MLVNNPTRPTPVEQPLPLGVDPERRSFDVAHAIRAARIAGAVAGTVATSEYRGGILQLAVHLYRTDRCDALADAGQARAVLAAFDIPSARVDVRGPLGRAGSWQYRGVTEDGVQVDVYAAGPVPEAVPA